MISDGWYLKTSTALVVSATLCCLVGCRPSEDTSRSGAAIDQKSGVVVTSPAIFWVAGQMLGEQIPLWLECREKPDETGWAPAAEAVKRMQRAEAILLNGGGEETWLQGVTIPQNRLADLSSLARLELIPLEVEQAHQHGPGGMKSAQEWRRGVSLDPLMLAQQATAIRNRLVSLFPDQEPSIESGYASVAAELKSLSGVLDKSRGLAAQIKWLDPAGVFHYLVRAAGGTPDSEMGFELAKLLESPAEEPVSRRLASWMERAERENVSILLPSDSRYDEAGLVLKTNGFTVLRLDSLDYRLKPGVFLERYRDNIECLAEGAQDLPK
jgi:ABC-type Zn uptake system ZnuABC Zn-binding protein ZnuA